jgi:dienelactone hydrolase
VRSVAALAPWLPDGEPTPLLGDRSLLLAHGTADRVTDPAKTAELAGKLAAEGGDVELVTYVGARHSMLFPSRPWHDMVASYMEDAPNSVELRWRPDDHQATFTVSS